MSTSSQNPQPLSPERLAEPRSGYIAGLRQFADWLETHTEVPVPLSNKFLLALSTNTAVREFAETHGLPVDTDDEGNASCDLVFGAITYHAYGYTDFQEHCARGAERQARRWAAEQGLILRPATEGGAR